MSKKTPLLKETYIFIAIFESYQDEELFLGLNDQLNHFIDE